MMRGRYGATPARFYWEGERDSLSVHLERDPGSGSMLFTRMAACTVTVESGDVDDIRRLADRLRRDRDYLDPDSPVRELRRLEADRLKLLASERDRV
jgi:hypothetical protein